MRTLKIMFSLCFISMIGLANHVFAQCDTFYNADAASQIIHTFPYPLTIRGLAFTDIDNDGDLDCYLLNNGAAFIPIQNKGSAKYPLFDTTTLEPIFLDPYTPYNSWITRDFEFADVDGDGDKDIFLAQTLHFVHGTSTNVYDTAFRYYQNIGTPTAPSFVANDTASPLPPSLADSIGGGVFAFYDLDKDGDLDYTYSPYPGYGFSIYLNMGSKTVPRFTFYTMLPTAAFGKPQYFDWNKDGLPDLFIGDSLFLNKGTLAKPLFTPAPSSPIFTNGVPYLVTDVNNDGAPEAYTFEGNFSTLTPVPVIDTTVQRIGNRSFIKYYSHESLPGYTYSWLYNGKPVAGYHKPFIYAEKKGVYALEITNTCGTGISLPYRRTENTLLAESGKSENSALSLIAPDLVKMYPNPFTESVLLQFVTKGSNLKSTVVITDLTGRKLSSETVSGTTARVGSNLSKGIYVLQVWQNGKLLYHDKLLKQ